MLGEQELAELHNEYILSTGLPGLLGRSKRLSAADIARFNVIPQARMFHQALSWSGVRETATGEISRTSDKELLRKAREGTLLES